MNDLLKSSDQLLGSSEWDHRIQQVNQSADERIKIAAEQSQRVVSDLFWRVYVAMGVLFVMLIICLMAVFLLIRRLRVVAAKTRDACR
jgi:cytochrome bd-type quinol oxidase subunit 1